MTKDEIEAVLKDKYGLSLTAEFVPFSQSRRKDDKSPSLNWRVTLLHNDEAVLTTDYTAGCGHCPSYKSDYYNSSGALAWSRVSYECESGRRADRPFSALTPDLTAVVYSLVTDSEALDYPAFEEWALEFGLDPDSRKAEANYKACLEIALSMRLGLGDAALRELRELFADY